MAPVSEIKDALPAIDFASKLPTSFSELDTLSEKLPDGVLSRTDWLIDIGAPPLLGVTTKLYRIECECCRLTADTLSLYCVQLSSRLTVSRWHAKATEAGSINSPLKQSDNMR